jgi:selenocysteine lyase/cysteine desulfurase
MGPMLKNVIDTGKNALDRKLNPTEIVVEDFFTPTEELRQEYARLIDCSEPNRIVLIPSVSYGIANVVANLNIPAGSDIILAGEQFPSNAYPWFRAAEANNAAVKIVEAPNQASERGKVWNEEILAAIDENTSVVALAICHWADGTLFHMDAIRKKTRECGAALVIDGTQSIGALPFSWEEVQPDALICAGYKWMLGPYSIGLACYGPIFDDGLPIEENWINRKNSEDFAGLVEYEEIYQPGALRYEVGEHSNFFLVPMLLESIKQINSWGTESIQEYCKRITQKPIRMLKDEGFWIEEEAYRGHHLFGIRIPDTMDIDNVKKELTSEKIFVSYRGSSIRIAPYLYNNEEDLLKLATSLIKLS